MKRNEHVLCANKKPRCNDCLVNKNVAHLALELRRTLLIGVMPQTYTVYNKVKDISAILSSDKILCVFIANILHAFPHAIIRQEGISNIFASI